MLQVFYFVWGNCLVAFGFVISTFFRVVKNAVVFGYIYTIGSGVSILSALSARQQLLSDSDSLWLHLSCFSPCSPSRLGKQHQHVTSKTGIRDSCAVFAAGLLGYLLFQQLIERGYSWVWVLEIVPSFALYRGLYEFSQYAFLAGYGVRRGCPLKDLTYSMTDLCVLLYTFSCCQSFNTNWWHHRVHQQRPQILHCNAECPWPWVQQHQRRVQR